MQQKKTTTNTPTTPPNMTNPWKTRLHRSSLLYEACAVACSTAFPSPIPFSTLAPEELGTIILQWLWTCGWSIRPIQEIYPPDTFYPQLHYRLQPDPPQPLSSTNSPLHVSHQKLHQVQNFNIQKKTGLQENACQPASQPPTSSPSAFGTPF
jgi:hypothetical protein